MKNNFKLLKKILALLIIFTLSINTYATQSSDDGSTFITKAEFDSLAKKFIDKKQEYEAELNAKIDKSVANYIGGYSKIAEADATMHINSIQSNGVMQFKVWQDPGSTLSGRHITASGGVSYQQDGQARGWGCTFNASSNTGSTTNNKSRLYQKDFMGYSVYLGTCYPYIRTTWTIAGVVFTTSNGGTFTIGSSTSRVRFSRTAPNTTTTTTTKQQYWSSSPTASGWHTQYGYLTHGQAWIRAASDAKDYYSVSANALSTSNQNFVREELRDTDDGMECTSSNRYSLNTSGGNSLSVNGNDGSYSWVESMPYWTVKTDSLAWNSLYNYTLVTKGYNLKLYEGVPLFGATLTGNATIKMKVVGGTTDITFADLCISSNKFTNAVISSGDTMTSISPAYDKSKASPTPETLKNVKIARVKSGDTVTIEMPVTLNKTYYVKLMPRTSATSTDTPAAGKYAYIARNMETIKIKAKKEDQQ